jgi:tripartite motif-containing protein 33
MCNVCKQETDVDCIIDNLFSFNCSVYSTQQESQNDNAQQTGQNERQSICTNCDENNYSEWYCTDCNELLCDGCRYAHSRVKVTKDHVITKNSSNNNCSKKSTNQSVRITHNCHTHTMEKLSIFCETCDILTCRDCQLSPLHKEHSYKYMHEAANLQRSKFTLCLKQLRQRKLLIEGKILI